MITKLRNFLLGKVIVKKVIGKFAKHSTGAVVGFLSSPQAIELLNSLGVTVDKEKFQAGLMIVFIGLFGAAWNFVEHRWLRK